MLLVKNLEINADVTEYRKSKASKIVVKNWLEKEYQMIENHAQYEDFVWRNRINEAQFINMYNAKLVEKLVPIIDFFQMKAQIY